MFSLGTLFQRLGKQLLARHSNTEDVSLYRMFIIAHYRYAIVPCLQPDCGPGSSVGIGNELRAGRSGD